LHDSIVLESGIRQEGFLDLEMRAKELPASSASLSLTESVSVSSCTLERFALAGGGLGGEPKIAGDFALDELHVVSDEDQGETVFHSEFYYYN